MDHLLYNRVRVGDEKEMSKRIMDGNEACSYVSYGFTEVAGIYPITPASPMAELTDQWSKSGKLNFFHTPVKVVEMESEAGAAGMVHGSLQLGCLTTTYTASQGLLLMIPNMYKMAGELLPAVIHIAARSLSTHALSIFGDHQDVYAARMTGFAILAESSVQQVMDLTSVAHLAAIKGRVPFINFFDGFRTSHELQKIDVLDMDKVKSLLDQQALDEFRNRSLQLEHPVTRGTSQNDDVYFQATEVRNGYYDQLPDIVNDYMKQISNLTGREYAPFTYYGSSEASKVIVAMGSVCETIKEVIDYLNHNGEQVGLIEVHLYRPFSMKYFLDVLPESVKNMAVLDRTKEPGSTGEPLYLDVVHVIEQAKRKIRVIGGRYGLSSKNTNTAMIKAVYDFLGKRNNFTGFTVGIEDDVTHLSIPVPAFTIPSSHTEFLVYGYGSDGMVSACKDLMKITGEHTNAYVQGYFQYDSKKSGGVTKSHLRFGKKPIRSTYYVENPSLIVCTKDSYLKKFKVLDNIQPNGIFLLNTDKTEAELEQFLTDRDKRILKERQIRFYTIDALEIAKEVGLDHKISSIMETVMFKIGHIISFEFAVSKMKEAITKRFFNKGNQIVNKNIEAMDRAVGACRCIHVDDFLDQAISLSFSEEKSLFDQMEMREGDQLPVSAFLDQADGTFEAGCSKLEKRGTSSFAPYHIKENCIECNLCSLVCPHAVIRPFLLNKEEEAKAPLVVQKNLMDANIKNQDLKYIVSASLPDCTGCKLCVNVCPGKKGEKALEMKSIEELKKLGKEEEYTYLFHQVSEKRVLPVKTVKGSQFRTPKFEFPGACAGCGETTYLKLLTQLFGDKLIIANATGCSSIYGASAPSTPYSVPWASSLFEDNAEYGYGMKIADNMMKDKIKRLISENVKQIEEKEQAIYQAYVEEVTEESAEALYQVVDHSKIKELKKLKKFIKPKSVWMVGGDGWAYDIGFNGIDHVLANQENVNILVLDTEVYSNTGGQASKSSKLGAVAKFASHGKQTAKKDLARIALSYPDVYVGSISLGASFQQAIQVLLEAESYDGPSIVLAYAPCIAQGMLKGMESTIEEEKNATMSGYYPIFHYNPETKQFKLDAKVDFDQYYPFLASEDRYRMLKKISPDTYKELLEQNKLNAIERYQYYQELEKKSKE